MYRSVECERMALRQQKSNNHYIQDTVDGWFELNTDLPAAWRQLHGASQLQHTSPLQAVPSLDNQL